MKFRVGDKVRIKEYTGCSNLKGGETGVVYRVNEKETYPISVRMDKPFFWNSTARVSLFQEDFLEEELERATPPPTIEDYL